MVLPKTIRAEDLGEVLDRWAEDLASESLEPALRDCLPILHEDFEAHFLASMGDNGPWRPRKDHLPHPILILTGALIESVRDTGNAGNISRVGPRELVTGVDGSVVKYAAFHQYGTSRMVARPFLWASEDAIDACAVAFADAAFVILVGA